QSRGDRQVAPRADPRLCARARLVEPRAAIFGRKQLQPRLPRRDGGRLADADAERVREERRHAAALLRYRAAVRQGGEGPERAPRRPDLAAVEPARLHARGARRRLVSETQLLVAAL